MGVEVITIAGYTKITDGAITLYIMEPCFLGFKPNDDGKLILNLTNGELDLSQDYSNGGCFRRVGSRIIEIKNQRTIDSMVRKFP